MVLIEDITEIEREREQREAAEKAAAAAQAAVAAAQAAAAAAARAEAEAAAAAAEQQRQQQQQQQQQDSGSEYEDAGEDEAGSSADEEGAADQQRGAPQPSEQQQEPEPPRELTAEEQEQLATAEVAKKEGNELYARGRSEEALERYSSALELAPEMARQQRAVYHCNRAACHVKLEQWAEAAQECSAALDLEPRYCKALLRRGAAYEALDDLERALADAQKALELEPGSGAAAAAVKRLTPVVEERREKLKEEMMGKLKELGNLVLGKFGLSTDNFKAEQDPSTGSYSIRFQH